MAPKPNEGHVVKKKKLPPCPSDSNEAPVSSVASASTQLNVGASPVYGITQLSPKAPACTVSSFPALSGSSPISDCFAHLPQEVLLDIFIRLPLKSIGRSRCVTKPWLSLLTSYEFIRAHLAHHNHLAQEQKLLLCSSNSSLFSLTLHLGGNQLRELELFNEQVHTLIGSCNGLVLVSIRGRGMWLINCMTGDYVKLPVSPFSLCQHLNFKKYGFGYDEPSDDYKIIKISQCDNGRQKCPNIFLDIYSLKMRSWKRLETPSYGHDLLNHDSCVFINGALHWIGLKFTYSSEEVAVIGAFDLRDEKFDDFPAPASVKDEKNFFSAKLMVIDGCLGIAVDRFVTGKCEIWLMKSYSLVESWTKLVIDFRPLCFHQDKILFCDSWPRVLKWYCLKDGRVELCLAEDDMHDDFCEGITYSETLVSPHFNYHN